jgi:hypothetical protein
MHPYARKTGGFLRPSREQQSSDVQEHLYCRPGNPEARRSAPSCDVQEQHTSGVQPEQASMS